MKRIAALGQSTATAVAANETAAGAMRRIVLLFAAMVVTLIFTSGVALAVQIVSCSILGSPCNGISGDDFAQGTNNAETIKSSAAPTPSTADLVATPSMATAAATPSSAIGVTTPSTNHAIPLAVRSTPTAGAATTPSTPTMTTRTTSIAAAAQPTRSITTLTKTRSRTER